MKKLEEYHDLYLKSDSWPLTDFFENFRKMFLQIYELEPAKFLSSPGLAQPTVLKKTKVELELATYIDMLLMIEKF